MRMQTHLNKFYLVSLILILYLFLHKLTNLTTNNFTRDESSTTGRLIQHPVNSSEKLNKGSSSKFSEQQKNVDDIQEYLSLSDDGKKIDLEKIFSKNLVQEPEYADAISPYLTSSHEVIIEAQRVHLNIFTSLLKGRKKAIFLFYLSIAHENKGDSALTVGEIILMKKLGIEIIFKCEESNCDLKEAATARGNMTNKEVVVFMHGGGNVLIYTSCDHWRANAIKTFPDLDIILFPQSIYVHAEKKDIDFAQEAYSTHPGLHFLWRDRQSYKLGKKLFPNVKSFLSPDIAFEIGSVTRSMAPLYDVIWIRRQDRERSTVASSTKRITTTGNFTYHVNDWIVWKTSETLPEVILNAPLRTQFGFTFLQMGRIVITDRLHGHILSTLLDIPHLLVDTKGRKVSSYHSTWTRSLENVVSTNSLTEAKKRAHILLRKWANTLPEKTPFV